MERLDSKARFQDVVTDYIQYRPTYPTAVVERLLEEVEGRDVVLDVGAGTGIFTRLLEPHFKKVIAVEPNEGMRAALTAFVGPNTDVVAGRDSEFGVRTTDATLVVAAQAFHWFDAAAFKAECTKTLRPGGKVALLWNQRVVTGWQREYEDLLRDFGTDYCDLNAQDIAKDVVGDFFGTPVQGLSFRHTQRFDWAGLEGRSLSCSYTPTRGSSEAGPFLQEVRRVFDAYATDGYIHMDYDALLFVGRVT